MIKIAKVNSAILNTANFKYLNSDMSCASSKVVIGMENLC